MKTVRMLLRPSFAGPAGSSHVPARLSGPWPRVAQVIWLALLLFVLYIFVLRLRVILQHAGVSCASAQSLNCADGQVTRHQARELQSAGLPKELYGIATAAWRIIFEVTYVAVAAILIGRKAEDSMATFTAFALLLFGGITVAGNPQIPPDVPQPLSFLGNGLAQLGEWAVLIFFYLFPDGRPVPRWAGVTLAVGLLMLTLPLPTPSGPLQPLAYVLVFLLAFGSVIFVQIYRYRKVSDPTERQQTKWIVYGMAVGFIGFYATLASINIPGAQSSVLPIFIAEAALYVFLLLIPLAIGFAMLRYRLWDVDVLINRTLVYGLLTACLGVLYIGGVVALQALFRALTGQGSGLAVAISTLAIAALFQPFRRGIQSFIDRRFYRRKYDAARTLASLSSRLRDDIDLDQVSAEIVAVVQDTMQPAHVSLWLR